MAQIISLNDYKITKQRQLINNMYHFFNEGLENQLDNILIQFEEAFANLCNKYDFHHENVAYFRLPIITFIVTVFIKNSEVCDFFSEGLILDNDENKYLFKNTLVRVLEAFEDNYHSNSNKLLIEEEIENIIEKGIKNLLKIMPENIYLV
ncbi:hypothetical protein [Clostridium formicaceticum]|uniref:Uncharacterized protein n=1 Tax=Clostridium formicaceticum TaxID=1497 RepID=A0AAC9RMM1_9CLOT|nr:hypothetical protein [Clostridium formicaceticum]AOY76656.1 hypothetical protein BJL90_12740 [Clostridium formicaceticum]ARE87080.1 hypothetical protein CLFO_14660 [Clostridium formicaceticum]